MKRYLIAWGGSPHAVREGRGTPREAAMEAFGSYDAKRMTFMPITRAELLSDTRRTRFIAEQLLPTHARRMAALGEGPAVQLTMAEIAAITDQWQAEWASYDRRYKRDKEKS